MRRNARVRWTPLIVTLLLFSVFLLRPVPVVQAAAVGLSTPYTQNFDALPTTTTTWTDDSSILPGWYVSRTGTGFNIVADTGSSTAGNIYSYGLAGNTERALGSVGSSSTGTVYWGVRLVNDSSSTITALDITYTGEQWRDGNNTTPQTVAFSYQVGATALTLPPETWTNFTPLDFTSTHNTTTAGALNPPSAVLISGTLTGLAVAPGQEIWLRWSDPNHAGSDHGLAIDDLTISRPSGITINVPGFPTSGVSGVSGVIGDLTGPTFAIDFTVSDLETPTSDLVVTLANNSNPTLAPNVTVTAVDAAAGAYRLSVGQPGGTAAGYANLTINVKDTDNGSANFVIRYAASLDQPVNGRYYTQSSDGSTGVFVGRGRMLTASDKNQVLGLYTTEASGGPQATFDVTANLGLTDLNGSTPREVDIEASAALPVTADSSRIFWLGSHSNNSSGGDSPNRSRIFVTDWAFTNPAPDAAGTLTYVGRYDHLKTDLINWDANNTHGLGANFLGLTASAAAGVVPETISGFNMEGLAFAPNSTTVAYVGFRAPLLNPTSGASGERTHALIVPISNFDTLAASNGTAGSAIIDQPILLDLGGRGIRSLDCSAAGCLIVAGDYDAVSNFRLYTWSGNRNDVPQLRAASLTGVNPEGLIQADISSDNGAITLISDNGETVWYSDNISSDNLAEARHQKFRLDTVTLGAVVTPPPSVRIRDIQGTAHISPLIGQGVVDVRGVVTAKRNNGFYIQDPNLSQDTTGSASSEGVFVFTGTGTSVPLRDQRTIGETVLVSGTVVEFRPGYSGNPGVCNFKTYPPPNTAACSGTGIGLSVTEIVNDSSVQPLAVRPWACVGDCIITPTVVGAAGRVPPPITLNTEAGNIEALGAAAFNPDTDGVDFYESLEGMVVELAGGLRVVGPKEGFSSGTEAWVVGATNNTFNSRGGLTLNTTDFYNPERIRISTKSATPFPMGAALPDMNVGALINSSITGIVDYSFHNFEVISTSPSYDVTASPITLEATNLVSSGNNQLTVATFNVENLGGNAAQAEFDKRAQQIVTNLKSPDIIVLEEMQDNNGTGTGQTNADTTFTTLIARIEAAGGPTYEYRQINPQDNEDGGANNGNIRIGFLFRPDRGLTFVDRPVGDYDDPTTITCTAGVPVPNLNPGRIDPLNTAFDDSRKPLLGEFQFNGATVFVIGNHWRSKGGDDPTFGPQQPPVEYSQAGRTEQAQSVKAFVQAILTCQPTANIIVAGDLNDFQFSPPVTTIAGITPPLTVLNSLFTENERYSYVYSGTAQTLDHILVSANLTTQWTAEYDTVHVNSEFVTQVSDHDPSIARFTVNPPSVPVLVLPAADAQITTNPPTLTWNAVPGASRYEVQLDRVNPPTSPAQTVTTATYTPTTPLLTTTYYWRVRAIGALNTASEWSELRAFTVTSAANAAPTPNLYTTGNPVLSWGAISWATGYELEWSNSRTFDTAATTYQHRTTDASTLQFRVDPALTNGLYFWRVRAQRAGSTPGGWSATGEIIIAIP